MSSSNRTVKRYSLAFKQKVVMEIESGHFNIDQARKLYGISGGSTIQGWMKQFGKNHLLAKVVRIETPDEVSRLNELERQCRQLESALAKAHLKIVSLESMLDEAGRFYQEDLKKKFATPVSAP